MKILDVVATKKSFPEKRVSIGQVGTILEEFDPEHVLVEFSGTDGVGYAIMTMRVCDLLELKHEPAAFLV